MNEELPDSIISELKEKYPLAVNSFGPNPVMMTLMINGVFNSVFAYPRDVAVELIGANERLAERLKICPEEGTIDVVLLKQLGGPFHFLKFHFDASQGLKQVLTLPNKY